MTRRTAPSRHRTLPVNVAIERGNNVTRPASVNITITIITIIIGDIDEVAVQRPLASTAMTAPLTTRLASVATEWCRSPSSY